MATDPVPKSRKANPVFLVDPTTGAAYMAGTEVASSIAITGAALTALQSLVTLQTAANALLTTIAANTTPEA